MSRESSRTGFGGSRAIRIALLPVVLAAVLGTGQAAEDRGPDPSQTGSQPAPGMLPARVEVGAYDNWVDQGLGEWRGINAEVWLGRTSRFVPAFLVDSQTRPTGTQQNYAFMSYLNWTTSFYTIQSVSGAPQRSGSAIYFPKIRYDIRCNWKLPPDRRFILGAGFTHFDFGSPGTGEIYNLGALYYLGRLVITGDLFVNQSRPGDLTSASGSMSVQYGTEGKYWLGLTASGGRELYRIQVQTSLDLRLTSVTLDLFYRRWITRHVGYVVGGSFQDKLDAYTRAGISGRVFFEF